MNIPRIVKIKQIINESPTVKTFIFDWDVKDEIPGQFMMVWNFNDEKPMSISYIDPIKNEIGISIRNIGEFTKQVHNLSKGDKLGLRGPYGKGFHIAGSKILAIGGGIGMAPIIAFSDKASGMGIEVHIISAATTHKELLFNDRIGKSDAKLLTCTDDGTSGFCGFGTDLAEKTLSETDYDMVICCGPEVMMKKLFDIVEKFKIPAQFSMERYMKCGMGLCGQCCVDNVGWRICAEGPVFWTDELRMINEFGQYRRDSSGVKHNIP